MGHVLGLRAEETQTEGFFQVEGVEVLSLLYPQAPRQPIVIGDDQPTEYEQSFGDALATWFAGVDSQALVGRVDWEHASAQPSHYRTHKEERHVQFEVEVDVAIVRNSGDGRVSAHFEA